MPMRTPVSVVAVAHMILAMLIRSVGVLLISLSSRRGVTGEVYALPAPPCGRNLSLSSSSRASKPTRYSTLSQPPQSFISLSVRLPFIVPLNTSLSSPGNPALVREFSAIPVSLPCHTHPPSVVACMSPLTYATTSSSDMSLGLAPALRRSNSVVRKNTRLRPHATFASRFRPIEAEMRMHVSAASKCAQKRRTSVQRQMCVVSIVLAVAPSREGWGR